MTEHPQPAEAATSAAPVVSRERTAGRRSERRSLRAEKAQLAHWRRLLRARLDLTVASFAPPEPLGAVAWESLPDAHRDLPDNRELAAAVAVVTPIDPVELMTRLRRLDRSLADYGRALDSALRASEEGVVHDLALHAVPVPVAVATGTDGAR